MIFPGNDLEFRAAFREATGTEWSAHMHWPWNKGRGWSTLFGDCTTWAISVDARIRPTRGEFGKPLSPAYLVHHEGTPYRCWLIDKARRPQRYETPTGQRLRLV
jgi:hypothetical protein